MLECAEIAGAVVRASDYFRDYNGRVLDDPRVKLIVEDGRNHLAMTDATYDVIISEPSNPWMTVAGSNQEQPGARFFVQVMETRRGNLTPPRIAVLQRLCNHVLQAGTRHWRPQGNTPEQA